MWVKEGGWVHRIDETTNQYIVPGTRIIRYIVLVVLDESRIEIFQLRYTAVPSFRHILSCTYRTSFARALATTPSSALPPPRVCHGDSERKYGTTILYRMKYIECVLPLLVYINISTVFIQYFCIKCAYFYRTECYIWFVVYGRYHRIEPYRTRFLFDIQQQPPDERN